MPPKSPDSIRSLGHTVIHLDAPTKAKFKQAAGDMPLIDYLRQLADRELSSGQGEMIPTQNTIASVKSDTKQLINFFEAF